MNTIKRILHAAGKICEKMQNGVMESPKIIKQAGKAGMRVGAGILMENHGICPKVGGICVAVNQLYCPHHRPGWYRAHSITSDPADAHALFLSDAAEKSFLSLSFSENEPKRSRRGENSSKMIKTMSNQTNK